MIVVDEFVMEESLALVREIADDEAFWAEKTRRWWDGKKAETPAQRLIQLVWQQRLPEMVGGLRVGTRDIADVRDVAGFEYWVAVMPEGQGLGVHVDADEELREKENEIHCPLFGSVFFPREDLVSGGALRLYGVSEQGVTEELASPHRAVDVILPNFNRLVIYAGNTPHEVAPVREGTRYSLVMNVWLERPMGYE